MNSESSGAGTVLKKYLRAEDMPPEGGKLQLNCEGCLLLCEVQIPPIGEQAARTQSVTVHMWHRAELCGCAASARAGNKPVRFQVKCPKCLVLTELKTIRERGGSHKRKEAPVTGDDEEGSVKRAATEEAKAPSRPSRAHAPLPLPSPAPPPSPAVSAAGARTAAATAARTSKARGARKANPGRSGRGASARNGAPATAASSGSAGGSNAAGSIEGDGSGGAEPAEDGEGVETSAEMLDDFVIEEASERLPVRSSRVRGHGPSGRHITIGGNPSVWDPSAYERTFPSVSGRAFSCEQAFEQALHRPRWQVDDDVEVAFTGKGPPAPTLARMHRRVRTPPSGRHYYLLLTTYYLLLTIRPPPSDRRRERTWACTCTCTTHVHVTPSGRRHPIAAESAHGHAHPCTCTTRAHVHRHAWSRALACMPICARAVACCGDGSSVRPGSSVVPPWGSPHARMHAFHSRMHACLPTPPPMRPPSFTVGSLLVRGASCALRRLRGLVGGREGRGVRWQKDCSRTVSK